MNGVLDDTLLADPDTLVARDTTGVLRAAATAGAQVRSAVHACAEAGLDRLRGHRPRALVFLRRPGVSGAVADLVTALLGDRCPVPVVHTDRAPGWIGPLDVVVVHTGDGTDPELAESVAVAVRRGAEVVLSAPDAGPVAQAGAGRARLVEPRIPLPEGLGFAQALAVALVTVSELELIGTAPDLEALADALDAEAERDHPGHEPFVNPAKSLALRLAERTPLLWGVDAAAAAVARHGADALATHAGVVAHADALGQAGTLAGLRVAVDVGDREADVFHDPFEDPDGPGSAGVAPPPRLVLLGTGEEDPQLISRRILGREWPTADLAHPVEEVPRGTRDAALLRAGLLALRADIAAVYLGLATRASLTA
ncbi:phospho-glucose isomerase C-terminal SIS domain-containing protein [Pseudonocardia ammonioxydans]|uniref:Phospho-glucose isomerase C-terminal SIS domain-containing protein n=1 Tax=Pseudonocardia ammonioxydans TaxID=260086 RepID=A0A1I4WEK6_PSUAM|nr:SIS domain-containing protein [Pseudonocardia ammonioxydans]SFN12201.1 phospho-glucose isomerase C-terminal SIS domain-containing protein [Pseudonocardia ammonioxydans]